MLTRVFNHCDIPAGTLGQNLELNAFSEIEIEKFGIRYKTGARHGHASANDAKIRLIYLTMQRDEYTERINQEIWEMLYRLFGMVNKEAAPVELRIDPAVCSPTETASVEIQHLPHEQQTAGSHKNS